MRDIFDSADKFLLPLDFINMKLTGNAVTDYTAAGGTMAFDMKKREWNTDLLGFAGVDPSRLASVGCMGDFVGTVLSEVAAELGIRESLRSFSEGRIRSLPRSVPESETAQ